MELCLDVFCILYKHYKHCSTLSQIHNSVSLYEPLSYRNEARFTLKCYFNRMYTIFQKQKKSCRMKVQSSKKSTQKRKQSVQQSSRSSLDDQVINRSPGRFQLNINFQLPAIFSYFFVFFVE